MPQLEQDVTIYQNAGGYITIAVTDELGVPMDLTAFDELCWILSRQGTEIVRYTLADVELGIVDADDTNDGLRVYATPAMSTDLDCGRLYIHQAWGTLTNIPRPICIGYVTVERGDGC